MRTEELKKKLDMLELKYLTGMTKSSTFPIRIMQGWARRYRIAMEKKLKEQCNVK